VFQVLVALTITECLVCGRMTTKISYIHTVHQTAYFNSVTMFLSIYFNKAMTLLLFTMMMYFKPLQQSRGIKCSQY
jgi:hypothetical protein